MIENKLIFDNIRSNTLNFFPNDIFDGKKTSIKSFSNYIEKGTYNIRNISNGFVIETSKIDFAETMWLESEYFINCAYEQILELLFYMENSNKKSCSWALISAYYFGFFTVCSLLRLMGLPTFYITKNIVNKIKQIKNIKIGSGTHLLDSYNDISATNTEYNFKKSDNKIHEINWKCLGRNLKYSFENFNDQINTIESLFYTLLCSKKVLKINDDYDWLSTFRNLVNYTPNYAYNKINDKDELNFSKEINAWRHVNDANIYSRLLSIKSCIDSLKDNMLKEISFTVFNYSTCMFILLRELYNNILIRRDIDKRFDYNRKKFIKSHIKNKGEFSILYF